MLLALMLLVADPCEERASCTGSVWELTINGEKVDEADTPEECEALKEGYDLQTPPSTELVCVEAGVSRQDA